MSKVLYLKNMQDKRPNLKYRVISRRYAKALFELAHEAGCIDKVLKELTFISGLLNESPRLPAVLESMEESPGMKKDFISELSDKVKLSAIVKNTLFLLIDRGLIHLFCDIFYEYVSVNESFCRLMRLNVTVSNQSYSDMAKKDIEKLFKSLLKRDVICNVKVDSSIIGGVILRMGDTVIDKSIKGRLERMRQEITNYGH